MYMPNLLPRDVHHLWLQPAEDPTQNKQDNSRNNLHRRNQIDEESEQNQRQRTVYAPPLSAYSSNRPGATLPPRRSSAALNPYDAFTIEQEAKLKELKSIRTLGYSYLAPLGVGKTMKTLHEEQEIKRQMDEQYQAEAPTAENLLGEGDNVVEDEDNEESQQPSDHVVQNGETETRGGQEETQATEQVDLDDDIPEAEENSYDHIYDNDASEQDLEYDDQAAYERQYDQAFMVSEEYQEDEVEQTPQRQRPGVSYHPRDQVRTPEHAPTNDSSLSGRPNAAFSSSFSYSGNIRDSFNDSTSHHPGDISINESDLDMVLDDD